MTWKERLLGIPLAVIGAVLIFVTAAGMALTRTERGREELRNLMLQRANAAIRGKITIDAYLAGDLFSNARLAGVRIYEPDGALFATVDTIEVTYRWTDFLFGNIVFPSVTLVHPVVQLRVEDDAGWNFDRVFASASRGDSSSSGGTGGSSQRRIVLRDVRIRSGDVTIRLPWEPGTGETAETSRWRIEKSASGWERVLTVQQLNATLPVARIIGPASLGRLFQIAHFTGTVGVLKEPILVDQLRADIEQHGDTISFDLWEVRLPDSHIFGAGWATLGSPLEYDFTVTGAPIQTADLRWLLPKIPLGVADLNYRMQSLPNGTFFEASNASWRSEEAVASGHFALQTIAGPNRVAFDSVELKVERFATTLIPVLTGWVPPADGVLSGDVSLDGSLSRLDINADVRFLPADGGVASRGRARGSLFATAIDPGGAGFVIDVDTLSLELVRAFVPGLKIDGILSGQATVEGSLVNGASIQLTLTQRDGDLAPSTFKGGGELRRPGAAATEIDVTLQAEPLAMSTLANYYPAIPFRGDYKGYVHAEGVFDSLIVAARFAGAGDSLILDTRVQVIDSTLHYDGVFRGRRVSIAPFREGIGESNLDFAVTFEGKGTRRENLDARVRAELSSSFVGGVRFDSTYVQLRVDADRLYLDTAAVFTEFGYLRASGALGLRLQVSDTISFFIDADSLSGLNRWIAPVFGPLPEPTLATDGTVALGSRALVEGSARATGYLSGAFGELTLGGRLEGERLRYGRWTADTLTVEDVTVSGLGDRLLVSGHARAANLSLGDIQFDDITLAGEFADSVAAVDFKLSSSDDIALSGSLVAEITAERRVFELGSLIAKLPSSSWRLQRPARLHLSRSGAIALTDLLLESEDGRLEASGSVGRSGPAAFRLHIDGLELSELSSLHRKGDALSGVLAVDGELSGMADAPVIKANVVVADGQLLEVPFSQLKGDFNYRVGEASLDVVMWRESSPLFQLQGTLPLDITLPEVAASIPERPLDLTIEGDSIPLNLIELLTETVQFSAGRAQANIGIRGTLRAIDLRGSIAVFDGRAHVVPTGISYRDLSGRASLSGRTIQVEEFTFGGIEGGRGRITGTVSITRLSDPDLDLSIEAEELPAYDRIDARMVLSGRAALRGPYTGATLTGRLAVVSGVLYIEEIGRRRQIVDLHSDRLFLLDDAFTAPEGLVTGRNPFLANLTIDQRIIVQRDAWLRSEETNMEIAGELLLRHAPAEQEFRIDGTLQALRGDYKLFNKRFTLQEGEIEFVGVPALNPNLRLVAVHRVQTQKRPLQIRVLIEGTLEEPTVRLESDAQPPIPESDLLSYLLFGRPTYEITRARGEQGSLIEDVAAGLEPFVGYALESLLVGETGIAYVDVSRTPVRGVQGFYGGSTAPVLAATQVEVGWYLAPTVFVSVAQHLSTVINIPSVRVEWKLNNNLTLEGLAEPRLARTTTLLSQNPGADLTETIGLFLFYGWSY